MNTTKNNQMDATTQTGGIERMNTTVQIEEMKDILTDLNVSMVRVKGFSTMVANVLDLVGKTVPRNEGKQAWKEFNDLSNLLYFMEQALPEQLDYIHDQLQTFDYELNKLDYKLNKLNE